MKIIAVDDEPNALDVLISAIKDAIPDQDVDSFDSSTKALLASKINIPDIAFMDINMPKPSGPELAKELKDINPDIKIIFVTGYSEYTQEEMDLNAHGYLMKPISPRDIKNVIKGII